MVIGLSSGNESWLNRRPVATPTHGLPLLMAEGAAPQNTALTPPYYVTTPRAEERITEHSATHHLTTTPHRGRGRGSLNTVLHTDTGPEDHGAHFRTTIINVILSIFTKIWLITQIMVKVNLNWTN
jgi:hypothetical protein